MGGVITVPEWHSHAMARTRVSTTVDDGLLTEARKVTAASSDAALLDQALTALLAQHRRAEVDLAYAAYDERPLDEPDEWGDLASFRAAAGSS
jgi:Arc/MetJ family transcription regulator